MDGGTKEEYETYAFPYSIIATKAAEGLRDDEDTAPYTGYYAYNPFFGTYAGETDLIDGNTESGGVAGGYDTLVTTLTILFLADGLNAGTHVIAAEDLLGNDETAGWFETYTNEHGGELVNDRYSKDLFSEVASEFEDITIESDDTYELTDNIVDDSAWNRLFGSTVQSENFISVSAIQAVTSADVAKYDKANFAIRSLSMKAITMICALTLKRRRARKTPKQYIFSVISSPNIFLYRQRNMRVLPKII